MEKLDLKGIFWLPEFPTNKLAGTLSFDPIKGAVLETLGDNFSHEMFELFGVPAKLPGSRELPEDAVIEIICGRSDIGDPVTLFKCWSSGYVWARGYKGGKYQVNTVFVGYSFERVEDISFDHITVQYSYLEEWFEVSGLARSFTITKDQNKLVDLSWRFVPPEPIHIALPNLQVKFYTHFTTSGESRFTYNLKETSVVEVETPNAVHYNDFRQNILYHLQNFLSLGIGIALVPHQLVGRNSLCVASIGENEAVPALIKIYYVARGATLTVERSHTELTMLFRYHDIADHLETCLRNWFAKAEVLSTVMDLYFSLFYVPSIYVHLEFLTLIQALESYHRRVFGGTYLSIDEYAPIREQLTKAIPEGIDENHRESLKSRIKYGYEFSLRKRLSLLLREVLAPYTEILDILLVDRALFINRVVDTRNYLTHYSIDPVSVAATTPQEQQLLAEKLRIIVQLCLMHELALPSETVQRTMRLSQGFVFAKRRHP